MSSSIGAIAKNTIKEILRDKILYGLIIFAFALIGLSLLLGELSFAEQAQIITNFGLAAAQLGCGMLAIFVGGSLVWKEIDKQTILTLLSKPVSRAVFLLSKFLGLGFVILLVDLFISIFLALICMQYGKVFWFQFIISVLGVFGESLLLVAITVFFGTFCKPMLTTLFTLSLWLVGHGVNDLAYFSGKNPNEIIRFLGETFAKILPNFEYLNFKEAVVYGDAISLSSIANSLTMLVAWLLVFLIASIWIFQRRDFI